MFRKIYKMRLIFISFFIVILVEITTVYCVMTEAQLKATGKLLRKNCQPKTKTTDESIENMHKGIWDDAPSTKCYAYCVMNLYKLVNKKGVFEEEYAIAQLEILPKARQDLARESIHNCKQKFECCEDKCEQSYEFLKCFYFDNPENYFAP